MPQFIFTYHGGKKPDTPEAGKEGMEKWKEWAASLGTALVNPGTPVGVTKVLTKDGVSSEPSPHPVMGFSIIEAENMEAALDLLKDCPHIHMFEGTLEVSEMMAMPG
ncbi:MAG: hypothetical protein P8Y36_01700 [Alphaproteobacteria bacterium]